MRRLSMVAALALVVAVQPSPARAESIGFVRDASGAFTTFEAPGGVTTFSHGINASGQVAGDYFTTGGARPGYIRDASGNFTTFTVTGGNGTIVTGLNDSGQVAGEYFT